MRHGVICAFYVVTINHMYLIMFNVIGMQALIRFLIIVRTILEHTARQEGNIFGLLTPLRLCSYFCDW